MSHPAFSKPVYLSLSRIGNFQARSPWEALDYLEAHWPGPRTAHYRRAKALCRAAHDGFAEPEAARRTLIDAAQRAGVLAQGWRLDRGAKSVYRTMPHEPTAHIQSLT